MILRALFPLRPRPLVSLLRLQRKQTNTKKNLTLVRRSLTEKAFGFGSAGEETQVFLQVPL